jgi:cell division protease FtsH
MNHPSKKEPGKDTNLTRNIIVASIAFISFIIILGIFGSQTSKTPMMSLSDLTHKINKDEVKTIEVSAQSADIVLKNGDKKTVLKEEGADLTASLQALGVTKEKLAQVSTYSAKEPNAIVNFLSNSLYILFPIILIIILFWMIARQVQKGNGQALSFVKSSARFRDPKSKTREGRVMFKDIAGSKEAKEELKEIVEFLKEPLKFVRVGAKIPKGVLLTGAPGTGKTMLARAVSNEAGVPFFIISGSEFVEMFVGVGASRVRDLFNTAKKYAPAIVFIDEIDAVGRQRGAGLGGSHDEREQTLNQILVEMDGFDNNTNVIVMAATNRPDVLDSALLRPGRFDRRIIVQLPDLKEREEILKVHSRGKPMHPKVDFKQIAQRTVGFSGADLGNLLNEAAILTARLEKKYLGMDELRESIEKVILGPERKSKVITDKDKKLTAYHEAGHAVTAYYIKEADPVQKVTIMPRGMAGGYTLNPPEEDQSYKSKKGFLAEISVLLGGYVSEQINFHDITTGPNNDLEKVTSIARKIVRNYGMSKLGPINFDNRDEEHIFLGREIHEGQRYSEKTANEIDDEVSKIVDDALRRTQTILNSHIDKLGIVAKKLIEVETIEKEKFNELMEGISEKKKEVKGKK